MAIGIQRLVEIHRNIVLVRTIRQEPKRSSSLFDPRFIIEAVKSASLPKNRAL
jgi:hypothetical protein